MRFISSKHKQRLGIRAKNRIKSVRVRVRVRVKVELGVELELG
jgi:hypothetical protein